MIEKKNNASQKRGFLSWLQSTKSTMHDAPMRAIEEFSALPVRRFSNKHSELAAGYVRFPSAADLISVANWIQSKAVFDLIYEEKEPFAELRRAAAYSYWHWAIRISRVGNSGTLLAGGLASSIFLLAAIGDRNRSERLLKEILELSRRNFIGNAGSKTGPFVMAVSLKARSRDALIDIRSQLSQEIMDSSGALDAYQGLVDCLFESDPHSVEGSIRAACQSHILETRQTTNEETHDFDSYRDALIPFEIVFYVQVRRWLGLETKIPDHPILALPSDCFRMASAISEDSVLSALVSRSLDTMEERQRLVSFNDLAAAPEMD